MEKGWNAKGFLAPIYAKVGGVDELARLTGIVRSTLSGYNTGKRALGLKNAMRIASAADVSLRDLGAPTPTAGEGGLAGEALALVLEGLDELRAGQAEIDARLERIETRLSGLGPLAEDDE